MTVKADGQLAQNLTTNFGTPQVQEGRSHPAAWPQQWLREAGTIAVHCLRPPIKFPSEAPCPYQAGLGLSVSKSHYQPLSRYQTTLNIYKALGGRVHVLLRVCIFPHGAKPQHRLQPLWTGAMRDGESLCKSAGLDEMQLGVQRVLMDVEK